VPAISPPVRVAAATSATSTTSATAATTATDGEYLVDRRVGRVVTDDLIRAGFRTLNRFVGPALAQGLGNPFPIGVGAVVIETTGRASGKLRQVPLLTTRVGDRLFVGTVRDNSQWLRNLEAEPAVQVQLGGRLRPATAATARGPLNVAVLTLDRAA
jgi:deazaflavin-dependent oxidoreductase (nitroreductase family)